MEEKKTFGQFVAEKRKECGLTQKELAYIMNVSESAVSKWETDVVYPDITRVPKLAELFKVTEHELLSASIDNVERKNAEYAMKWVRLMRRLNLVTNWVFPISFLACLFVCFLVNIINYGTLTWFWVVFATILLVLTITTLPMMFKKYRFLFSTATQFIAMVFLLGVISSYTNSSWFIPTVIEIGFGCVTVFTPIYIHLYNFPKIIKKYNAIISITVSLIYLLLMLMYFKVL